MFETLSFVDVGTVIVRNHIWPKIRTELERAILHKVANAGSNVRLSATGSGARLYYKNTGLRYFNTVTLRAPKCWINGVATNSSRETIIEVKSEWAASIHTLLLSSTFFVVYQALSNCRDLNPSDLITFGLPPSIKTDAALKRLSAEVETDCTSKAKLLTMNNKLTGEVVLESMSPSRSKPIIDEIDCVLAKHYGFTDEELDFIINYDFKYRMGSDATAPDVDD